MNKAEIRRRIMAPSTQSPIDHLTDKPLRVAGYKRVGVSDPAQSTSMVLFRTEWASRISGHTLWTDAGLYVDEGRDYASRDKLLADCHGGSVDLVITKSIIRFFRSLDEAVKVLSELAELENPVGIFFEDDGLYTLSNEQLNSLLLLAAYAEEESRRKSETMTLGDGRMWF